MKNDMAKTSMNVIMNRDEIGASSQQLYAQFIYRILKIKELFNAQVTIGLFSPPLIFTGGSFKGLRAEMKDNIKFVDGMLFQASQFADVADNWGISFTIWDSEVSNNLNSGYPVSVKETGTAGILSLETKILYNMDNEDSCSNWIKADSKHIRTYPAPQMKSALNYDTYGIGNLANGALGYYFNISNIVEKNSTQVFIVSSCCKSGHGISILPINFDRVVSNYTARRLMTGKNATWINSKDEYMIPNLKHVLYKQWESDSIIYSLFNTASNQSSLRKVDYKIRKWDIYNQFFFMSKAELKKLALR